VERLFMPRVDHFIQAYPTPEPGARRQRDLLWGL